MEIIKLISSIITIFFLVSCSDDSEIETGEIKTIKILWKSISKSNSNDVFLDARKILSRTEIDKAKVPVLFVELKSTGQNGTLTPYPGEGVGKTWLGADGATITLDNGVLKASRGMGNDLMGSKSSKPSWRHINKKSEYTRELLYLNGKNQVFSQVLNCQIYAFSQQEIIMIWEVKFLVYKFEEHCSANDKKIKNVYFIDKSGIARRSLQYHSETIGYLLIERLDQLN